MKTNFKIVLIFIVSICSYSCCTELWFDKEETFWTDVYEKGDIIVFKSSPLSDNDKVVVKTDTIFILNKTESKPTGDCNTMVSKFDVEGCVIDYSYKHDSVLSEPDLFVQHFKEEKGASLPVLRVYDMEFSGKRLKDTTIVLNTTGTKLNDCFTFSSRNGYKGWSTFKLKSFVWSKKMGLVQFVGEDGQKFEFVEKISNRK